MRILLTNDDGFDAPGLKVLEGIARALSDDVWIVAPEREQSGASRALTLHMPLRAVKRDEKRYAVSGTPGDCVLLAVRQLMDRAPDSVLSGVNRGQNLAEDVSISGTVAGALKGTALGIPSIAFSQAFPLVDLEDERQGGQIDWAVATAFGPHVLKRLVTAGWPKDITLNVNFPGCAPDAVGELRVTHQGARDAFNVHVEQRTDLRGFDYYWLGFGAARSRPGAGTDLEAIYTNHMSVTPLDVDLTHAPTVASLRAVMDTIPA